jgi:hypothetical protein
VDQILIATDTAFRASRSVRLVGSLVQQDQPMTVDMRVTADRKARGSITRGKVKLSLVRIGDKLWLRGASFWKGTLGAALAERIGDRWVLVPDNVLAASGGSLSALTDMDGIASQIISPEPGADINKGPLASVNGVSAVQLTDAQAGSTLYVAADGTPYPLRLSPKQSGKTAGQKLDFTEYDRAVSIRAPKDVVKL